MMTTNDKLLKALKEMPNPTKDTKGYGYMYATLDQVMGIIKPALQAQGLDVTQQCTPGAVEGTYELKTYIVGDDGDMRLMDTRPLQFSTNAQSVGSYETYMRRYALLTVFGLCPEDDDGRETTTARPATQQAQRPLSAQPMAQSSQANQVNDAVLKIEKKFSEVLRRWCELHDNDFRAMGAGIKKRPDFERSITYYKALIDEFNADMPPTEN